MPVRPLRVLCVHGIGGQERNLDWQLQWRAAIQRGVARWNPEREALCEFVAYDDLFEQAPLSPLRVLEAVGKLVGSGIVHGIADMFRRSRGAGGLTESARWTAGMIVQWTENGDLRKQTRKRVLDHVRRFEPDAVLAHSLGSLVCYDAFLRDQRKQKSGAQALAGRAFVSFGSQIANPFVRSTFGGRIEPLAARNWYHLFNRHDDVFTARLRVEAAHVAEIDTEFDVAGIADHDALEYLGHANTEVRVWRELAAPAGTRSLARAVTATRKLAAKPRKRALLVGINQYPQAKDRLEGCVNDVFLMSSLLQENGYDAEDIRVVLDERATAAGICERLGWLLDGTQDGAERFLYYSGHGAQIPAYGPGEKVDRLDECLVPVDFQWTRETAITDDQFAELYSNLPYEARFVVVLDCCHSGGMVREGGARVRGLTPPDDVRHRALRWDSAHGMWVERPLEPENPDLDRMPDGAQYVGASGAKRRLGRSVALRRLKNRDYNRVRTELGHYGPYLPVIFEACREDELAYEYRHGVISHGAFTWSFARFLRERRKELKPLMSYASLSRSIGRTLEEIGYDQRPALTGPSTIVKRRIPWR